jgi:hypothetical protein
MMSLYICTNFKKTLFMKKLLIAFSMIVSVSTVSAQINKGQWLVGGNAGFTSSKEGDFKTTTFQFSPNAGYFFINNLAGGLRLNINSQKEKFNDDEETATTTSIAPFVRYYFLPAAQKVNVFADASYSFGSVKYDDGTNDEKVNVNGFSVSAGPAIFLTPNTALELTLGYNSSKIEDADESTGTFLFGVGFQIHLGNSSK